MQTAFDIPRKDLDDQEKNFLDNIQEFDFFTTAVMADEDGPGFAYTTGLYYKFQHPELIVFRFKPETAHGVLSGIVDDVSRGVSLQPSIKTLDVIDKFPVVFFPTSKNHYRDYLGWSRWFYRGDSFPSLQLVWPDMEGVFPWEEGFNSEFEGLQPNLSDNDWDGQAIIS